MKKLLIRLFLMTLILSVVLLLSGCGGSPASQTQDSGKTSAEAGKAPDNEASSAPEEGVTNEMTVQTGIGKEGGEVKVKTGNSIAWDPGKMGGMPQPEGTTVYLAMDVTKTMGHAFAYSYSLAGLTKANYEEYIKLVEKTFPTVLQNTTGENEGLFMANTADGKQTILVTFAPPDASLVQYYRNN